MNLAKIMEFDIKGCPQQLIPIQNGYINDSFSLVCKTESENQVYFLQKVNTSIFQNPDQIGRNIEYVSQFLKKSAYQFTPLELVAHQNGTFGHWIDGNYWRLFVNIGTSFSLEKVENPNQAYASAKAYSHFTQCLAAADTGKIKAGIPAFFDFKARIRTFEKAILADTQQRVRFCRSEINWIQAHVYWIGDFLKLKLPKHLIHADPKIGNLLFDANSKKVKAVIDWDTIMESSILIDFGDMIRSMSLLSVEDELDAQKVLLSTENVKAIEAGFLEEWGTHLTILEKSNMFLAAKVIILVQAIRFLTDFIQGDIYYNIKYETHNYIRAYNQIILAKAIKKYN